MFKKGMRIMGIGNHDSVLIDNMKGTVLENRSHGEVPIQFDARRSGFHNCNNLGRDGYCFWCDSNALKVIGSISKISISDVTTEFERLRYKRRSIKSLSKGIGCSLKDVKIIIDGNSDIFTGSGDMYERVISLE